MKIARIAYVLAMVLFAVLVTAIEIKVGTGSNVNVAIGTGGPWRDSMVPGTSFRNGASAPTLGNFVDASLQVLRFAKAADNLVHGAVQLNHDYIEGSDIETHVHVWFPAAALAAASTNVWSLTYSWADMGAVFPGSTTVTVTNSGAVTKDEHRIIQLGSISGTGKSLSSILVITLQRTGTDAYDVYDDVIGLLGFDVHYMVDGFGSETETSKVVGGRP